MSGERVTKDQCDAARDAAFGCYHQSLRIATSYWRGDTSVLGMSPESVESYRNSLQEILNVFDAVWSTEVAEHFILHRPEPSRRFGSGWLVSLTASQRARELARIGCSILTSVPLGVDIVRLKIRHFYSLQDDEADLDEEELDAEILAEWTAAVNGLMPNSTNPVALTSSDVGLREFDQCFFWLWHSGTELPRPFARISVASSDEADWILEYLNRMADETFQFVESGKGLRRAGETEFRVHRTSLRERIANDGMDDWLHLCNEWPDGPWKYAQGDEKEEYLRAPLDMLHDWSEQAVIELRRVRIHSIELKSIDLSRDERRAVVDVGSADTQKKLSVRERKLIKALAYIREKGPICGAAIASHIGVDEKTFRTHYVPDLKKRGVKNDGAGGDGYYLSEGST